DAAAVVGVAAVAVEDVLEVEARYRGYEQVCRFGAVGQAPQAVVAGAVLARRRGVADDRRQVAGPPGFLGHVGPPPGQLSPGLSHTARPDARTFFSGPKVKPPGFPRFLRPADPRRRPQTRRGRRLTAFSAPARSGIAGDFRGVGGGLGPALDRPAARVYIQVGGPPTPVAPAVGRRPTEAGGTGAAAAP